ncbi:hypothetical protein MRS44_000005 [Fusarium solani]|uniref:uncharacterized protein n=1 Tax=Fusarium solani TaxID=169388 RepID=UPI0032C44FF7|nr:hypothetical protein MRS44_000005 [Fusarium solani]
MGPMNATVSSFKLAPRLFSQKSTKSGISASCSESKFSISMHSGSDRYCSPRALTAHTRFGNIDMYDDTTIVQLGVQPAGLRSPSPSTPTGSNHLPEGLSTITVLATGGEDPRDNHLDNFSNVALDGHMFTLGSEQSNGTFIFDIDILYIDGLARQLRKTRLGPDHLIHHARCLGGVVGKTFCRTCGVHLTNRFNTDILKENPNITKEQQEQQAEPPDNDKKKRQFRASLTCGSRGRPEQVEIPDD